MGADLRVAFVACNKNAARFAQDPAFIYRCDNLAHALAQKGVQVWLGHMHHLPLTVRWDVVVFHRPKMGWRLRALMAWLGRRGTQMVADVDDLVFDPSLAQFSPGVVNGLVSLDATREQFKRHRAALQRFDVLTVSTQALQVHAQALAAPGAAQVVCVPNTIHWQWRERALPAVTESACVAYMPGTRSHDRDLASVAPALEGVLAVHEHLVLQITGPLTLPLQARAHQVLRREKLPFHAFHQAFEGVGLNLAPLEPTPFNECKSAIKVMEAAWWGVPTVFCHLPDALRFVQAGGVQAHSAREFGQCVADWAHKPQPWLAQRQALRERVLPEADVYAAADVWLTQVAHA